MMIFLFIGGLGLVALVSGVAFWCFNLVDGAQFEDERQKHRYELGWWLSGVCCLASLATLAVLLSLRFQP
jgi:hypothetical protein